VTGEHGCKRQSLLLTPRPSEHGTKSERRFAKLARRYVAAHGVSYLDAYAAVILSPAGPAPNVAEPVTIALPFGRTRVMNRHAQMKRRKGTRTHMTNAETNTAVTVAAHGAHVAPEKASLKKVATGKKGAPKAKKNAKGGKAKAAPRAESKTAKILEMIARAKGATLAEIVKATGWQAHSVRGFISTAGKKHSVKIESSKNEAGDRVYRIAK